MKPKPCSSHIIYRQFSQMMKLAVTKSPADRCNFAPLINKIYSIYHQYLILFFNAYHIPFSIYLYPSEEEEEEEEDSDHTLNAGEIERNIFPSPHGFGWPALNVERESTVVHQPNLFHGCFLLCFLCADTGVEVLQWLSWCRSFISDVWRCRNQMCLRSLLCLRHLQMVASICASIP